MGDVWSVTLSEETVHESLDGGGDACRLQREQRMGARGSGAPIYKRRERLWSSLRAWEGGF